MTQFPSTILAEIQDYRQTLATLLIYGGSVEDEVGQAFVALLDAVAGQSTTESLRAYSLWFQALATTQETWSSYLQRRIAYADNPFTQQVQRHGLGDIAPALEQAARHDLALLQRLHALSSRQVADWIQVVGGLDRAPVAWDTLPAPLPFTFAADLAWPDQLEALVAHYQRHGVGPLAQYQVFTWQHGDLRGVAHPDPVRLDTLTAYDHPRQQLRQNTLALLRGYPALNVLLYGSRGSGKSSLVKALVNEYGPQGLRLIEVPKPALTDLPQIVNRLRHAPQKFIVFVDDLSFEEDDEAFKALKVVLEGSVTARPQNLVVYATSNRRHLVREYFSDRPRPSDQDEVQAWDTVQEKLSFSDRFGLTLTFEPADQSTYLAIVYHLAQQAHLALPPDELTARSLQWATRHNGRSGRTARQFIDWITAEQSPEAEPPSAGKAEGKP
ncbi:MAG: ATP-binding protein [Leptolyngbya sp.]|nr:ATP-binding protein [Leptolyngbya sp.]